MSAALETPEKPAGSPADLEARRLAKGQETDLFDDTTTDNTAAVGTSPEEQGLKSAQEMAEITGEDPEKVAEPPAKSGFTVDELAAAIRKAAGPEEKKVETPQLTQEQIDAALGTPKVDDALYAKIMDPATGKAELEKLLREAGTHGAKMSSVLLEQKMAELAPVIAEIRQHQATQIAAKAEKEFFENYPGLAGDDKKQLLEMVSTQLDAEIRAGKRERPNTPTGFAKLLAEETGKLIKSVNPAFDLAAKVTPKPKTTVPRQAVAATTGVGGSGTKAAEVHPSEKNRSKGTEVFD